jgi:hypothetical protein
MNSSKNKEFPVFNAAELVVVMQFLAEEIIQEKKLML